MGIKRIDFMPVELTLLEDGRLMHFKFISPVTSSDMRAINKTGYSHIQITLFRVHVVIDVVQLDSLLPEFMRVDSYRNLLNSKVGRCAIIGAHPTLRAINNALTKLLNYRKLQFFAAESEAFEWVRAAIEADKQGEQKAC
jgi:hypothetical protein